MHAFAAPHIQAPFWAFWWPGGQSIARYVLDNPQLVRGKVSFSPSLHDRAGPRLLLRSSCLSS